MNAYRFRDDVKHFCGMVDGLAFLPPSDINEGLKYLRDNIPDVDRLEELLTYFDNTYVSGTIRQRRRRIHENDGHLVVHLRRTPPLFPISTWNMYDETLNGDERTNNACESWNNSFRALVGHQHPSVWTLISALQQDQALVTTCILQDARGQPPTKRRKIHTEQHQKRLRNLCVDIRDGRKSVVETLRGFGHNIRLTE